MGTSCTGITKNPSAARVQRLASPRGARHDHRMARKSAPARKPRSAQVERRAEPAQPAASGYAGWKARALAVLREQHGIAAPMVREKDWRNAYVSGASPDEAAETIARLAVYRPTRVRCGPDVAGRCLRHAHRRDPAQDRHEGSDQDHA